MSSSSPCAGRAAARVVHVLASITALSSPHEGWWARARASTMNNNESMPNNNMTPTSSAVGTSISMLTAVNIPTHDVNCILEGSKNDVDFVEAGRGGGFDDDLVEEEESGREEHNEPVEEELPPLQSIFDCAYIVVWVVNDGKDGWECRWCGKILPPNMPHVHFATSLVFVRMIL